MPRPDNLPKDEPRHPVLIGLDWGTTALRAYLFDALGTVVDRRHEALGIQSITDGRFRQAFEGLCAPWLSGRPTLPVIACGMVGSRQGWREAPYVHAPAGFQDIAERLTTLDDDAGRPFRLIPGVQASSQMGAIDVMRGEETQILGAMAVRSLLLKADPAHRDGLFVLPGTHSKWVEVRAHRIVALRTYLTGEAYGVLREHSILGRLCADPPEQDAQAQAKALAAFDIGVQQAHSQPGSLLHLLFLVRTEGLFARFTPQQLPAYLSGLLTGAEIADARTWCADELPPTLIGTTELASRYARALHQLNIQAGIAPEGSTAEGLFAIAVHADLVPDYLETP